VNQQPQDNYKTEEIKIPNEALKEPDWYTLNGITKVVEVSKHEFETIITKKTSIVYKSMKL
jgi:hypothetical protein